VEETRRQRLDRVIDEYSRTQILRPLAAQSPLVPPGGPLTSPVVVIGEAPGADEVTKGAPFVGRAGQHLQYLLKREARLDWLLLYRTNVVLFRPPGNRTPYPFEIMASVPRLEAELDIVRPLMVLALGATAWNAMCRIMICDVPYSHARGRWFPYGITGSHCADLLVTWHPSAALRDARADRELAETLHRISGIADDHDRGKAGATSA
jgi:uracil-DNA glycosylase